MLSRMMHGKRKAEGESENPKEDRTRKALKAEIKSVGLAGPAKAILLDAYEHCGTSTVPSISSELTQSLGEFRAGRYGGEPYDKVVEARVRAMRSQPQCSALWAAFQGEDKEDPFQGRFGGLTDAASTWQRVAAHTFLVEVYALKSMAEESKNVVTQRLLCADSLVTAITGGPSVAFRLWDVAHKAFLNGKVTPVGQLVATEAAAKQVQVTQAPTVAAIPPGGRLAPGARLGAQAPGAPYPRGGCNFCKAGKKSLVEVNSHREVDCAAKKAHWAAHGWAWRW